VMMTKTPARMAGTCSGGGPLKELISPFLQQKMFEAKQRGDMAELNALRCMYCFDEKELHISPLERTRHYQSGVTIEFEGKPLHGVERLYRRTVLIEPTMACSAHCRWCLRGQYEIETLSKDDISRAARWFGSSELQRDVNEILITGGDPAVSPFLLDYTIAQLVRHAPNIRTMRLGSRLVFHDPARVAPVVDIIKKWSSTHKLRFEMGIHACHPCEVAWPESAKVLEDLRRVGCVLYCQNPLLRGVNDDLDTLVQLFQGMRELGVEAHYLFHAIPMLGTNHHRTTVQRGLELAVQLSACGKLSGRAKPKFALLTDIGKVVLYDGSIIGKRQEDHSLLIKTGYSLKERQRWNPSWKLPSSGVLLPDGDSLAVWYMDAI